MSENLPPPGGGAINPASPPVDSSTSDIQNSDLIIQSHPFEDKSPHESPTIDAKNALTSTEIAPAGENSFPNPSNVNVNGTSKLQSSQVALRTPTALIAQETAPVGGRYSPSIPSSATQSQSRNNSLEDWKFITANSRIVVLPDPRIHTLISSDADDLSSTGTSDHVTGEGLDDLEYDNEPGIALHQLEFGRSSISENPEDILDQYAPLQHRVRCSQCGVDYESGKINIFYSPLSRNSDKPLFCMNLTFLPSLVKYVLY